MTTQSAGDNKLPDGQCWLEYVDVDGEYRRRPVQKAATGDMTTAFTIMFVAPTGAITHQNCLACRVGWLPANQRGRAINKGKKVDVKRARTPQ